LGKLKSHADWWPELSFAALAPTMETLQLFSQVVGKVRLAQTPWLNHSWHVTLYVSARGLTTSLIPHGAAAFDLEFDFLAGALILRVTDGGERRVALAAGSVAAFHGEVLEAMAALGVPTSWRRRSPSASMPAPGSTTARWPPICGGRWCGSTGCWAPSVRAFWENAVRCISSGGASTWRSRGFRAGRLRLARAPMRSRARRTRMK